MYKRLLNPSELAAVIRTCYESDPEHITKVHVTGDQGLDHCINRTIVDLICFNTKVYALEHDGELVGYFGDESYAGDKWLTGFFLMPDKRKSLKKDFWDTITAHFGSFKSGLYDKNEPARKFLMKNGCILIDNINGGSIFEYKERV